MDINTTYAKSISFTAEQEEEMARSTKVEVFHKHTGRHIATLSTEDVLFEAQHRYIQNSSGAWVKSPYKVYNF